MAERRSLIAALGGVVLVVGCASSSVAPTEGLGSPSLDGIQTTAPSAASAAPTPASTVAPTTAPSRKPIASGAVDPAAFASGVDNTWFPLVPGTILTYQGTKDDKKAVETFAVTDQTKTIDGVPCVVVEDRITLGGVLAEKVVGYYAQDLGGNVWYFGEDSQEIEGGQVVNTDGSWHAGVDKAPPALFMEATPTPGKTISHDYTKNDFVVISLAEKVVVPYGSFTDALVTKEWSPVEPDVETHKFYEPGLGAVRDVATKGPTEEFVLVKVDRP